MYCIIVSSLLQKNSMQISINPIIIKMVMTWLIFWKLHTLDLKTFNNNSIRTYITATDVEFTWNISLWEVFIDWRNSQIAAKLCCGCESDEKMDCTTTQYSNPEARFDDKITFQIARLSQSQSVSVSLSPK